MAGDFDDIFGFFKANGENFVIQGVSTEYRQQISRQFPLCHDIDFDLVYFSDRSPLGLRAKNIAEFNRQAFAGGLSYLMQLQSVDYTLKRYAPSKSQSTESRLDYRAIEIIDDYEHTFERNMRSLGLRDGEPAGIFAADLKRDIYLRQKLWPVSA